MVTSPQARAVRSPGQFPESSSFFHWSATSSCAICSCTLWIASSREMKPLVSPRFAACVGHPAVGAGLLRAPQLRPAVQVVPGSADRRPAFDLTTFTKNRERLLGHEIADRFFAAVVRQAELRRYITPEHFSVDGTLLGAWAHTRAWRPRTARSPPGASGRRNGGRLPGWAAEHPNAPLDDRSGGAVGSQGPTSHRPRSTTRGTSSWRPIGADRGHGADPGRRGGPNGRRPPRCCTGSPSASGDGPSLPTRPAIPRHRGRMSGDHVVKHDDLVTL